MSTRSPLTSSPADRPRPPLKKILKWGALGLVGLLVILQAVPYGRDHANPKVTKAIPLDAAANSIFVDACADCHSNLTKWPWYTNVAPASWLVQSDVDGGRQIMNMSEWDKPQPELDEIVHAISEGEMPPLKYKIMPNHVNARLSDKEKQTLIDGFKKAYAADPPATKRIGTQERQ